MLIHEVCKECNLTKKAVEYYTEQGLICPKVLKNGYRDFSESDIERLKKIAVLRGLDLAVSDIQTVLASDDGNVLQEVSQKKDLKLAELQVKQELMEKLAHDNDWEYIHVQLYALEKRQSVLERLTGKFPGFYGKYLTLHFARFLGEPITTEEQQKAFETIIDFLDKVDMVIPKELQDYLDLITKNYDKAVMQNVSEGFSAAIQNIEQYMADNKEIIEQYREVKNSDEYKHSSAYKLQKFLEKFNNEIGYYDVFIPAMKRLSNSYKKYYDELQKANEIFTRKYKDHVR